MTKNYSIDQLATTTARRAQSESAILQGDLRKLRDGLAGLTAAIRAPVIRAPRLRTKKTTDVSLWETGASFGLLGLVESGIGSDLGLGSTSTSVTIDGVRFSAAGGNGGNGSSGFYASSAQQASDGYDTLNDSLRIR